MLNLFKSFFSRRSLAPFEEKAKLINRLESEFESLSNEDLRLRSLEFRMKIQKGESLNDFEERAFAITREAAKRTLGQRMFDVQIVGGLALTGGAVAEMATGEGKTLTAVGAAYFSALQGDGVHIVTVNDYLARRDAVWMGQIYHALGLTVSCIVPGGAFMYDPGWKIPEDTSAMIDKERDARGGYIVQQEYLRPIGRREAYLADVTYGTNHEFGFDYLRDNLAYSPADQVQRGQNFAIIDEVDSVLIDEARTPLIIAAPDSESSEFYKTFARIVGRLGKDADYSVDEKFKSVGINDSGIEKVERALGISDMYGPEHLRLVHYLEESLKAKELYRKDKDYIIKDGEIVIVDEFTGRLLHGRRYNGGLHQAIEAKEGVLVKQESRTYAKISIQNYFRLYRKISGMTGTAQTSAEEFHKVYDLEVVSIPTNRPLMRRDNPDLIYKNSDSKWRAVVALVKEVHGNGQPILLGTTSIAKNELISGHLSAAGIPHEVLNAKNNEREGAIIAQAGRKGAVTVATNMAGRGVDIILGGNPPDRAETDNIRSLGGLCVIGTERHEARRIDNQLRGRSGRQGDPGMSQFFMSLDDDLMRIFGGERVKNMMERFNIPEDQPIDLKFVSKVVAEAQAKVEGANFDLRKHLLEYDDVLNKQRMAVYARRREILFAMNKEELSKIIFGAAGAHADSMFSRFEIEDEQQKKESWAKLKEIFFASRIISKEEDWKEDEEVLKKIIEERSGEAAGGPLAVNHLLGILDMLWLNHLENLDALGESVGLRAYGQRDPLVEYRHESHRLYGDFWANFNAWIFDNLFRLTGTDNQRRTVGNRQQAAPMPAANNHTQITGAKAGLLAADSAKVGRNDPCPCGSGKKYKRCHGA